MGDWLSIDDPRSLHRQWMIAGEAGDDAAKAALLPLLEEDERRYSAAKARAMRTRGHRLGHGICGHCKGRVVLGEIVETDHGAAWVTTYEAWIATESHPITEVVLLEWPEPWSRPGWLQSRCRDHGQRGPTLPAGASREMLQAHALWMADPAHQGRDSLVAADTLVALERVRSSRRSGKLLTVVMA